MRSVNPTPEPFGSPVALVRAPLIWVLGVWLLGLALTAWLTLTLNDYQNVRLQTRFSSEIEQVTDAIERRFSTPLYGLMGAKGVYAASRAVNRAEFRRYVESRNLTQEFPGLRGMGFIERVPRAGLAAFTARERADGAPEFAVRTQGNAPDLYVIKFIEPMADNLGAQGFDVGSEPVRRAAAERAARTGLPALSGVIQLVQDQFSRPGFLLFVPVYQPDRPLATPEQRLAALQGLVFAPIVLEELLQPGSDLFQASGLHLHLSDNPETAGGQSLFSVGDEHGQDVRLQTERAIVIAGLPLFLKVHSTPMFDSSANPLLVLALGGASALLSTLLALVFWQQATGRARAEARARRMTVDLQKLALVAQRTANSVLMTDAELRITWVNEGFTRVTGYSADQALGKTPGELLGHDQAAPAALETLRLSAEQGVPCQVEMINRTKDGRELWLDIEVQPLRDNAGQLIGFVEVSLDVTQARQTNARLVQTVLESQAQQQELDLLARVAREISNAVVLTNAQGQIEWVNAGFTRMTGFTLAEALGEKPGQLFQCPETDPTTISRMREALDTLQPCQVEILNRAKDGRVYWLELQIQPLYEDGRHTGFMAIQSDITAQKTARLQIDAQRERLDNIIKGTNAGTWEWHVPTGQTIFNERWAEIIGYTLAELGPVSIDTWMRFAHPDDLKASGDALQRHFSGELEYYESQSRMRHKNGHWVWVLDRGQLAAREADGQPGWMFGTHQDMTAQKQAEVALRQGESRMRTLSELSAHWFWEADTEHRFTRFTCGNPDQMARMNALALGRLRWEMGVEPQNTTWPEHRAQIARRETFQHLEYFRVDTDGHERYWSISGTPYFNSEGEFAGYIGTGSDISERKIAEVRLARSEALLERTAQIAKVGAWRVDLKTGRPEWSAETCRIHEVPVGHQPTMEEALNFYPPEARPIVAELVSQGLQSGEGWDVELPFVTATGRHIWVRALGQVEVENGRPAALVGAFQDITLKRQQADALLAAKTQAEQASQFKSQFLANMSHEIRTPMNAILGMLKLLHSTPLQPRQLDYVDKTEGAAQSLLGLLNDILDFSKVEAGKMTLDPQPFGLDKLLRGLSVIFSTSVGSKPVEVLFDIDPQVPRWLVGDSLRLQQILINLGGNAIKFTDQGNVALRVRLEALEHPGDAGRPSPTARVCFSVTDSGIGIAPENQAKIFAGFTQAEASTTRRFGGTGLGLSICRRLIELMGGELQMQSALGEGSTFSFTVPLPVSLPVANVPVGLPAPGPLAVAPARRVLVVDDNPLAREVLGAMGASLGWAVELADSGESALALISARAGRIEPYHTVFVDGLMPGLDGWQTSARIRSLAAAGEANAVLRVILMVTAHGREMLAQQTAEVQALIDGYLVKPVTATMMFDAMQDTLQPDGTATATRATTQVARPLDGLRVLLVEDNAINQQVADELLSGQGALIDIADNGLRGVEAVAAAMVAGKPYHAVLMDMQMPVMDGLAATREIRSRLGMLSLPIIAMTANAMASDREVCLQAGMNDHVGKPFALDRLIAILLQWTRGAADLPDAKRAAPASTDGGRVSALSAVTPALLNRASALQRVGGSVSLLNRLSTQFLGDLPRMLQDCETAVASDLSDVAQRALHTLKGVASTIGAEALADVALLAETACKNGDRIDLGRLHTMAAQTRRSLLDLGVAAPAGTETTAIVAAAATVAPSVLTQAQREILQRMLPLLEASNMAAVEVMYELLAQGDSLRWASLNDAVQVMDFGQAANWVGKVLSAD